MNMYRIGCIYVEVTRTKVSIHGAIYLKEDVRRFLAGEQVKCRCRSACDVAYVFDGANVIEAMMRKLTPRSYPIPPEMLDELRRIADAV